MVQSGEKARRRSWGQYYTPAQVVHLAYDLLAALAGAGDASGERRVIDPACGDGAFLRVALERGLADPAQCVGFDKDPAAEPAWADLRARGAVLMVHEGLYASGSAAAHAPDGSFEWVVGNPPYAGAKLSALRRLAATNPPPGERALAAHLCDKFVLWRATPRRDGRLPLEWDEVSAGALSADDVERLATFPIEVLFLERFVQLSRPGGLLAIVLPDGVLANARLRHVRAWALERLTMEAVVALPRSTFRAGRTTAKTALVVARHAPPPPGHITMLVSLDRLPEADDRVRLVQAWRQRRPGSA